MDTTADLQTSESYTRTLDYLFNLQRVGVKYSLDNIRQLLNILGNPHRRLPAIHIAGTNGKGSTAAMLFAIARAAGLRAGLYTSPHLVDFRERIRINETLIPVEYVVEFTRSMRTHIERIQPSFFEVTTAMAFQYFAEHQVELVILEAGMGGRLDSTNIVRPLLSVITHIGLDHQNYLGNTLGAITREKAGILKAGVPALTIAQQPEVDVILQAQAETVDAPLEILPREHVRLRERSLNGLIVDVVHPRFRYPNLYINLVPAYQAVNALLAIAAVHRLPDVFPKPETPVRNGLATVHWPGRLDVVRTHPVVLVDVSHNAEGMQATLQEVKALFPDKPLNVVVGLQADKDFQRIGQILAHGADTCVVVPLHSPRQLPPHRLAEAIRAAGGRAEVAEGVRSIWHRIMESRNGVWLITGSHYVAGAVYGILEKA